MTKNAECGVAKASSNAIALGILLVAVISMEAMYLEGLWKHNEVLREANDQLEVSNSRTRTYLAELRSAAQKIKATFTRLNDGIVRVPAVEGRLPTPGHSPGDPPEYVDSKVVKSLKEYGLVIKSLQESRHEPSVSFVGGSNQLELHRLVPFLAEQENSNAFLFVDKLDVVRPAQIPAFSMNPTGLETRLLIRLLAGPK